MIPNDRIVEAVRKALTMTPEAVAHEGEEEENAPLAPPPPPGHPAPLTGDAAIAEERREGGELEHPRQGRLPAAGWAVEDGRCHTRAFDQSPQRRAGLQQVTLADHLFETRGAHPHGQRRAQVSADPISP